MVAAGINCRYLQREGGYARPGARYSKSRRGYVAALGEA
jgi:hypothetical protein